MPELPEVETVRRILEPQLVGLKIESVQLNHPQVIAHPQPEAFAEAIKNQTITGTSRRGKFLTLQMSSGSLTIHLRMTGQLLVTPPDFPQEKHTHLILHLSNGQQLRYIDVRRFGRFWLLEAGEEDRCTGRHKLGPEPFDSQVTATYLQEKLEKRRKPVKEMLLDQSVVAGIGNIYADEILFHTKIYPGTLCCELTAAEWERLAEAIPAIMEWGIETNAMSPEDYLAGKGKEYRNTPDLKAYGHAGKPCPDCGTLFEKMVVGGRSSCYCPHCQPERRP